MHLTPNGHLTQAQQDEANKLGITTGEMTDIVLQRIADYNKERCSKNDKKLTIKCKNPIIVIGHGPNWQEQARKIKGTKIPIIATDVCSTELMDMGIIPTYITTYEEAYKRINEKLFDFKRIDEHSVQVIGSTITREWMDRALDKIGMDLYRFTEWSAYEISNVGIFSCMFADRILKCDKIILIGMNCWDGDKGNPYLNWYVHWRQYINKKPDNFFINCTQDGVLYLGKVLDCDFNNLEIEYEI
jgi:hypothetical protein